MEILGPLLGFSLIFIMFSMGVGLSLADFRALARKPMLAISALGSQIILLPLLALSTALFLDLPGILAVGLILIAACPGGVTSNIFTRLANGDVAFSVGLTAMSSIITVLTIPAIVAVASNHFLSLEQSVALPYQRSVGEIFFLTIIPISLGMLTRWKWQAFSKRYETLLVRLAALLFACIIVVMWYLQWSQISLAANQAGIAVIMLLLLSLALSAAIARLVRAGYRQTTTFLMEIGIQNSALAFYIATELLGNIELAIPASVYSVAMLVLGCAVILARRRKNDHT